MEELQEKVKRLPHKPGVYIYKNASGRIIYVGKAIDLRRRVTSYFKPLDSLDGKLASLVPAIADLDFIITKNELEALFLEATLIKKHRPRFNVMLKDDKGYPYIKITNEEYPRMEFTRRVLDDGGKYFGPYTSSSGVRGTIAFLQRMFPLRMCAKMKNRSGEPCMYYHIGKCAGVCSGMTGRDEYDGNVRSIILFLQGRLTDVIDTLREEMSAAAAAMQFEKAGILRDRLASLEAVAKKKQEVVLEEKVDMDVIGLSTEADLACAEVMFIRSGYLVGHEPFVLRAGIAETPAEILESFMMQYYAHREDVPPEILVSETPESAELLSEFLTERRMKKTVVIVPKRGKKKAIAEISVRNAAQRLADEMRKDIETRGQAAELLEALREKIRTTREVKRIVGFDISTIQGTDTVGSAVAFTDGMPDSNNYRKFIIRGAGTDDFSSMREMAFRYLTRVNAGDWQPPDLIIVDGGKGQLSAVAEGIRQAKYELPVLVMGFAKEAMLSHVLGRPRPIQFKEDEKAVFMVRRVIAEAHRFAITFHRKKRGGRMLDE